MENMNEIVTRFNRIIKIETVTQKRINVMNKYLENIPDECEYKDTILNVISLLEVGTVKKTIIKKIQKCLDTIKSNETVNNEDTDIVPYELIDDNVKLENLEKDIDSKIKKYSGFSENNPMDYVSFHTGKRSYECNCSGIRKYLKNKEKICDFTIDILRRNFANEITEIPPTQKACISYKNKTLIAFANGNEPLFDIQHILLLLGIKESMMNKKYKEFSSKINHYICVKNEYGGYFIRELIPEEVMYEIVLSSDSDFSKSFKQDVSLIIKKARQDGKLFINMSTSNIEYDKNDTSVRGYLSIAGCDQDILEKTFDTSVSTISAVYLFTIGQVKTLRDSMNIDEKYDDENIVVKFGMTDDLRRRSKEHHKNFKKYGGNTKLKYYAWIDETFQSNAETAIKKYFSGMKVLFSFGDMKELAIVTHDELKDLRQHYSHLFELYGGKLKNMNSHYEKELSNVKNKLSIEKEKHKCTKIELEKQLEITEKECAKRLFQLDKEYAEKLVQAEKEKNNILQGIIDRIKKHHSKKSSTNV
jgi:hypothetical protein